MMSDKEREPTPAAKAAAFAPTTRTVGQEPSSASYVHDVKWPWQCGQIAEVPGKFAANKTSTQLSSRERSDGSENTVNCVPGIRADSIRPIGTGRSHREPQQRVRCLCALDALRETPSLTRRGDIRDPWWAVGWRPGRGGPSPFHAFGGSLSCCPIPSRATAFTRPTFRRIR